MAGKRDIWDLRFAAVNAMYTMESDRAVGQTATLTRTSGGELMAGRGYWMARGMGLSK